MFEVSKNRWCNIYTNDTTFAIDIFVGADVDSRSAVVIAKPHDDNLVGLNNK